MFYYDVSVMLEMWPLRGRIDLARHGAWSAVTRDTFGGLGAGMATGITPQIIKLKNLSPSSSARAFQEDSEDYSLLFGPESSESSPGIHLSLSALGAGIFFVLLNIGKNPRESSKIYWRCTTRL